jgi:nitroreductase
MDALEAIRSRRSVGRLFEPAPSASEVEVLLEAARWAPDHGELKPWSFTVLQGAEKDDFGQVLADAYTARCAAAGVEPMQAKFDKERTKLGRAPMVIVVGAVRRPSEQIPWIEQQPSAAAAAQNILLAATALGYGSMWRTGDPAYDDKVKAALGLSPSDAITGFIYVGTAGDRSHRDGSQTEAR